MWRRRVAAGLVVLVATWPAVAALLSHVFDTDPWKLSSFGMYSTAARTPGSMEVSVLVSAPAGAAEAVFLENASWVPLRLTSALQAELQRFMVWRQTLGRLETGRRFAEVVLETAAAPETLLVVRDFRLDPQSARVREQITLIRFAAHNQPH